MGLHESLQRVEQLEALASAAGADNIMRDAAALAARVREERFFVACIGQFKRGKSTLINALLGTDILPSGVAPVTSVVTVVRYGSPRARVCVQNGAWSEIQTEQIADFVAEERNPQNSKHVAAVEVYSPCALLERGLCLVDTPGIGSVFSGNTAETKAFLPHVDAALVVLGGDPPVSGDELALLATLSEQVQDVVVVLNKADRLSNEELEAARSFTHRVIQERVPRVAGAIFEISALERLRDGAPTREWNGLVACIERLAAQRAPMLVDSAAQRGLERLAAGLRHYLEEERAALLRPQHESAQRVAELRCCAAEAQQSLYQLGYLFDAEQANLAKRFAQERERFLQSALLGLVCELEADLAHIPFRRGPSLRRFARERSAALAERTVRAWLAEQSELAQREFSAVTERFFELAENYWAALQKSGQLPTDVAPLVLERESGLRTPSRYYFSSYLAPAEHGWAAGEFLLDLCRSETASRAAAAAAGRANAEWLLRLNADRVEQDVVERVLETRRGVEGSVRRALEEIGAAAERAIERAQVIKSRGESAVQAALAHLEQLLAQLATIASQPTFDSSDKLQTQFYEDADRCMTVRRPQV